MLHDPLVVHAEISRSLFNISHFLKQVAANKASMSEVDMENALESIQAQADHLLTILEDTKSTSIDELELISGSKISSLLVDLTN